MASGSGGDEDKVAMQSSSTWGLGPSRPGDSPSNKFSEERLVAGVLAGDRTLAGELYDYLRLPIDRTLRRVLHFRDADFEDLVQNAFERILRGLAEGRFEGRSSLKTWACAIASHVALDALRRKIRERSRIDPSVEGDSLPSHVSGVRRAEVLGDLRRVHQILSVMKEAHAETLILHDVLGYKLSEVADLMGASESATQSRLHRARLDLKRRVEKTVSALKPQGTP